VRTVVVKLDDEVESIDKMFLIDETGKEVGQLILDAYDNADETWRGEFSFGSGYVIPVGKSAHLGLEVSLKPRGVGGKAAEMLRVRQFLVYVQSNETEASFTVNPASWAFPSHQTAQSTFVSISSGLAESSVQKGKQSALGRFELQGKVLTGASLYVSNLVFTIDAVGVSYSELELGRDGTATRGFCSIDSSNSKLVSCDGLPPEISDFSIGAGVVTLYGKPSWTLDGGSERSIRVSLEDAGTFGTNGAVRWSDGPTQFSWLEMASPIARGPKLSVTE